MKSAYGNFQVYPGFSGRHGYQPSNRPASDPGLVYATIRGPIHIRNVFLLMLSFFSLIWITIYVYASQNTVYGTVFLEKTSDGDLRLRLHRPSNRASYERSLQQEQMGTVESARVESVEQAVGSGGTPSWPSMVGDTLSRLQNYSCPTTMTSNNVSNTLICGSLDQSIVYKLVFFTTMYYNDDKQHIFNNTLHVIASLKSKFNMLPLLFIEDPSSFVKNNATFFLQTACDLGWVVVLAPHCNRFGFPVFRSMFNVSMATWESEWYGYSNGDMLFDDSLMDSIDYVQRHTDVLQVPLLIGRRYNRAISNTTCLGHYSEVKDLFHTSQLDRPTAVDYFIARKDAFPWERVGDFVVGRPVFDTWMVWFATKFKLPMVDTTATVRAVHQMHQGRSFLNNTHMSHRVQDGMDYNRVLADTIGNTSQDMRLVLEQGYMSCVPLKLLQMRRADVNYMVANGLRSIIGRGRLHFPKPEDDKELMNIVALSRMLTRNDTSSDRYPPPNSPVAPDPEAAAPPARRKLLAAPRNRKQAKEKNTKSTAAPQLKTHTPKNNNVTLHNDSLQNTGKLQPTASSSGVNMLTTTSKWTSFPTTTSPTPFTPTSNRSTALPFSATTKKASEEVSKKAPVAKLRSTVPAPAMVPYVHAASSHDFVYVLVRRTHYLIPNADRTKYRKAAFHKHCNRHDNIDLDVAQLLTL